MSLKSQEAEEGNSVTLCCELSKKGGAVQWKRETQLLSEEIFRGKYEMKQEGKMAQLTIINLQPEDAGKYSCITGDEKTTAEVRVKCEFISLALLALLPGLPSLALARVQVISCFKGTVVILSFCLYKREAY